MARKISVSELQVGMRVVDTGISWTDQPFLFTDSLFITTQAQIQAIMDAGYLELFVEEAWPGDPLANPSPQNFSQAQPPSTKPGNDSPTPRELAEARVLYDQSLKLVREIFKEAKLGRAVNHKEASLLVEALVESVTNQPQALGSLLNLKKHDEYTFGHSVNVAVLTVLFGMYLGRGHGALHGLGLAGIFHDLGKAKVPHEILNKAGPLTEDEFKIIKLHPIHGAQMLEAQGLHGRELLRAIREHHEKHDGSGYPDGLTGDEKSLTAKIVSLADIYDALTSDRPYSQAASPNTAMRILYQLRDMELPAEIIDHFIKCLGIYPVGSLVRLKNGQVAVVCQANTKDPLHPMVNVILDEKLKRRPHMTLDLSSQKVRAMGQGFAIAGPLDPAELGLSHGVALL